MAVLFIYLPPIIAHKLNVLNRVERKLASKDAQRDPHKYARGVQMLEPSHVQHLLPVHSKNPFSAPPSIIEPTFNFNF